MIYPKLSLSAALLKGTGKFFVIGMAIGAVFLVISLSLSRDAWLLEKHGRDVIGKVQSVQTGTRRCGKRGHSTCTYYRVGYRFTPENGVMRSDTKDVDQAFYARQRVGEVIRVRYVEGQPALNEIEPGDKRADSWWLVSIVGAIWMAVAVFGSQHIRSRQRGIYLRDNGRARKVQVVAVRKTNSHINKNYFHRLVWAGPAGESWGSYLEDLPVAGTEVVIYEDPSGKWPAVWEGDVGSRNTQTPGGNDV